MRNSILSILLTITLIGCAHTQEEISSQTPTFEMVHPNIPTPPSNPGVKVLVLTTETIKENRAYVGFEYDEWLNFAKWMHTYKSYNKDLLHVIELYKNQDPEIDIIEEK